MHKSGARQALRLALALCGAVGMVLVVGQSAMAQSTPKTVFQCKKAFGPGSKRTACIKRVEHEKPGSSCSHPLESSFTLGGPAGDMKDFGVKFKTISDPEPVQANRRRWRSKSLSTIPIS